MNSQATKALATVIVAGGLGLVASASATRVLEPIEGGYEAVLTEVVLPASTAGYVIVPPCSACPPVSLGVSAQTAYLVERAPVPFADFMQAANALLRSGRAERAAVYVFYDLETTRVTRVVLDDLDL